MEKIPLERVSKWPIFRGVINIDIEGLDRVLNVIGQLTLQTIPIPYAIFENIIQLDIIMVNIIWEQMIQGDKLSLVVILEGHISFPNIPMNIRFCHFFDLT